MMTFIEGSRPNAARISDEVWERYKPIIVEKYRTATLSDVKEFMEREHNFFATKRQYVHRFHHIWDIRKYKQSDVPRKTSAKEKNSQPRKVSHHERGSGKDSVLRDSDEPLPAAIRELPTHDATTPIPLVFPAFPMCELLPWVPQPNSADAMFRHVLLADILRALGDAHYPFVINSLLVDDAAVNMHTVACVRTAQTREQVEMARGLVTPSAGTAPVDEGSWAARFRQLLVAHTYGWGIDGIEQIARIIDAIIQYDEDRERDYLVPLARRGPHLDIPAYIVFRSALVWFNWTHEGGEVDIRRVLGQFVHQHLPFPDHPKHSGTDPLLNIDCLVSCLTWCIEVLGSNRVTPLGIPRTSNDPVAETYTVLCTLWRTWLSLHQAFTSLANGNPTHHRSAPHSLSWADNAESQLDIRATELLATVVCMIMTAVPQKAWDAPRPVLERALAGASALSTLGPGDLVHRFLEQIWVNNRRQMAHLTGVFDGEFSMDEDAVSAEVVEPYRRFVAEVLGVDDLPVLGPGVIVYPPVLVGHR